MKNKVPYFFLGLAALLALGALILLINRQKQKTISDPDPISEEQNIERTAPQTTTQETPPVIYGLQQKIPPETSDQLLENLGLGAASTDPRALLSQISNALQKGDMTTLSKLIGKDALNQKNFAQLNELAKRPNAIREIGEMELNQRARWALELDGEASEKRRILFDLHQENGKWRIKKIKLPEHGDTAGTDSVLSDPLNLADAFLQAVLNQDFESARGWVDGKQVSETKIAGLCILFEEGKYQLRKSKPLRAMFKREDTVGYIANIESPDGSENAQFSLNLRQDAASKNWQVSEINLDQLLADYAKRFADGDIYYSPLVKNPAGGETLALYFEFNEDSISPRTRRQLDIVASMLKSDPAKKITLSGHADAVGTKSYNDQLSASRADVVRDFLNAAGVSAEQIVTIAKGASQPRRPNVTESGEDNPEGRRANRRTEIYLDF